MQIIRQPLVLPRLVGLRNFLDTRIADDYQGLRFNTRRLRVERGPCSLPFAILLSIMILIAASTFGLFIPLSFGAYYRLNIDIWIAITLTSISSLFTYHTAYFYVQVLYKDPGIIIPNNDLELADNLLNHKLRYINLYFERAPVQISIANNKSQLKFCTTCRLYRPLKASHCSKCNFCIAGFDHHCAYLNICIGQKNYSTFMKLITFGLLTVLTNCVFGGLLVYYLFKATSEWVVTSILLISLISVALLVNGLLLILDMIFVSYHWKFISKNITTKEYNNNVVYTNRIDNANGCLERILKVYFLDEIPSMFKYALYSKLLNTDEIINSAIKKNYIPIAQPEDTIEIAKKGPVNKQQKEDKMIGKNKTVIKSKKNVKVITTEPVIKGKDRENLKLRKKQPKTSTFISVDIKKDRNLLSFDSFVAKSDASKIQMPLN